jgi:putative nucleotidyltransferase with HDIG domain
LLAQQTFEETAAGKALDLMTVRDLVQLLIVKVARSNAALGQILAVKQYENLTYCHSVNVAMLSLLLGRQLALDEFAMAALVEAALLHDIGKTKIPLEIVKKPGALTKRERKLIDAHTTIGAEILAQTDGLRPLTPVVALEHHRGVKGGGYPDLGSAVPHIMSQIVSVADIYEAVTGARSYQEAMLPERACLILARLAGEKLNTSLVKAFVNAITFFPMGSLVRTNRDELGVVMRTSTGDPLHPVLALLDANLRDSRGTVDTATRDGAGSYERHIVETLRPPEGFDAGRFLAA